MATVEDLLNSLPTSWHVLVYEKMQTMSEEEQKSFLEDVGAAIASYNGGAPTPKARSEEDLRRDEATPNVGDMAPDFELATLDGDERVRLSALRGKPVGLIFGSYT